MTSLNSRLLVKICNLDLPEFLLTSQIIDIKSFSPRDANEDVVKTSMLPNPLFDTKTTDKEIEEFFEDSEKA